MVTWITWLTGCQVSPEFFSSPLLRPLWKILWGDTSILFLPQLLLTELGPCLQQVFPWCGPKRNFVFHKVPGSSTLWMRTLCSDLKWNLPRVLMLLSAESELRHQSAVSNTTLFILFTGECTTCCPVAPRVPHCSCLCSLLPRHTVSNLIPQTAQGRVLCWWVLVDWQVLVKPRVLMTLIKT